MCQGYNKFMSRFPVQALEFLPKGKLTKYTNIGLVVDKLKFSLTARQVAGFSQLLKKNWTMRNSYCSEMKVLRFWRLSKT